MGASKSCSILCSTLSAKECCIAYYSMPWHCIVIVIVIVFFDFIGSTNMCLVCCDVLCGVV